MTFSSKPLYRQSFWHRKQLLFALLRTWMFHNLTNCKGSREITFYCVACMDNKDIKNNWKWLQVTQTPRREFVGGCFAGYVSWTGLSAFDGKKVTIALIRGDICWVPSLDCLWTAKVFKHQPYISQWPRRWIIPQIHDSRGSKPCHEKQLKTQINQYFFCHLANDSMCLIWVNFKRLVTKRHSMRNHLEALNGSIAG